MHHFAAPRTLLPCRWLSAAIGIPKRDIGVKLREGEMAQTSIVVSGSMSNDILLRIMFILPHPLPVGISLSVESKLRMQSTEKENDMAKLAEVPVYSG